MKNGCPLCLESVTFDYHRDKKRLYKHCPHCDLVFVPTEFHTDTAEEKRIYDLHENDPYDPGYRRFLSRLAEPLLERLAKGCRGLDFGCGPGPALARMLEEKGHTVSLYDPYYFPDKNVLMNTYDFICATEVLEHLRQPGREIKTLLDMLKDRGYLAIMTKLVTGPEAFRTWHYIQDQTHICYYSKDSFRWLADQYGLKLEFVDKDVIFLSKK